MHCSTWLGLGVHREHGRSQVHADRVDVVEFARILHRHGHDTGDAVHGDGLQLARTLLAQEIRHVRIDDRRRQVQAVHLALRAQRARDVGLRREVQRHERLAELDALLLAVDEAASSSADLMIPSLTRISPSGTRRFPVVGATGLTVSFMGSWDIVRFVGGATWGLRCGVRSSGETTGFTAQFLSVGPAAQLSPLDPNPTRCPTSGEALSSESTRSGRDFPSHTAMTSPPTARPRPAVVVTLPTYNESENILPLVAEILALGPGFEVVVIDDHSPDGTWKIVEEAARTEPRLHLIHRTQDRGRGRSGRDGFVRALEMGANVVVEMDADFSHQPRYVPQMLRVLNSSTPPVGLVLGSRGAPGGRDADRGFVRRSITVLANAYIRLFLGVRVRDCNSGFRAWKRSTLEAIRVQDTFSPGPAIVQELLFKTARARIGIAEVPIEFHNRLHGESTLTFRLLLQGFFAVLRLRWMSWMGRL